MRANFKHFSAYTAWKTMDIKAVCKCIEKGVLEGVRGQPRCWFRPAVTQMWSMLELGNGKAGGCRATTKQYGNWIWETQTIRKLVAIPDLS